MIPKVIPARRRSPIVTRRMQLSGSPLGRISQWQINQFRLIYSCAISIKSSATILYFFYIKERIKVLNLTYYLIRILTWFSCTCKDKKYISRQYLITSRTRVINCFSSFNRMYRRPSFRIPPKIMSTDTFIPIFLVTMP